MVSVPLGVFTASGFTNTKNTFGLTNLSFLTDDGGGYLVFGGRAIFDL